MTLTDLAARVRRHYSTIAIVAYAFIAIVTFGHSAARKPLDCPERAVYCFRSDLRSHAVMSGLVAGMMWPLYWSWELADRAQEASND